MTTVTPPPTLTREEMQADQWSLILILSYYVLGILTLGVLFLSIAPAALGDDVQGLALVLGIATAGWSPTQALVLLCAVAGALGAMLHGIHFSVHAAKGRYDWRWTPWHLLQPFKGALLGLVMLIATRAGVIVFTGQTDPPSQEYAILFACTMGGLFAHATLRKLSGLVLGDPREDESNA